MPGETIETFSKSSENVYDFDHNKLPMFIEAERKITGKQEVLNTYQEQLDSAIKEKEDLMKALSIADSLYKKGFGLKGFSKAVDNVFMPGCTGSASISYELELNSLEAFHQGMENCTSNVNTFIGLTLFLEEKKPRIKVRQTIFDDYMNISNSKSFEFMRELFKLPEIDFSEIKVYKLLDSITEERSKI